jgi:hypothetical protein
MTYEPYLNRMTLEKFTNLLERTGPWRKSLRVTAVKGLTPLLRWGATREYFCGRVSVALDVPG